MEFCNNRNEIIRNYIDDDDDQHHRQNNNRFSNFTIDHILNRAGEKYSKLEINLSEKINNNHNLNSEKMIFPIFDWLNYTRYKPPKLPSE